VKRKTALGLLGSAASIVVPARARAANDTVRVISFPIDTGLEVHYAQSGHFDEQAGLKFETQMMSFGAASQSALLGGSADIVNSNPGSLAIAREHGFPLVIVAAGGLYSSAEPTSTMMVPKDSTLRTARDFAGKTIAINGLNSLSHFAVQAWIDKNGGDSKSAHYVDLPFAQMPQTLASHRIDAALLAEPNLTAAKQDARIFANVYDAVAPHFVISIWVSTQQWVSANPDVARRFAQMLYRTATWANAHRAQTADVLAATTKLDPANVKSMNRIVFAESADAALIQPQLDITLKYGAITKPVVAAECFAAEVRDLPRTPR
jgi:NitT/TauT family transport system substrate-binding protein